MPTTDGEAGLCNCSRSFDYYSPLRLLQSCWQIRDEAQCIFYARNNLSITSEVNGKVAPTARWEYGLLTVTSRRRLQAIMTPTLRVTVSHKTNDNPLDAIYELKVLIGLKTLHLRLNTTHALKIVVRTDLHVAFREVARCAISLHKLTLSVFTAGVTKAMDQAQQLLQGIIDEATAAR